MKIIEEYKVIFFDFDGVIKDSVDVKCKAYVSLFGEISPELKYKISTHHLSNGGMPREIKIPLYMSWVGMGVDRVSVEGCTKIFSAKVVDDVINSPWVLGVEEFIKSAHMNTLLVIVTATPLEEIILILQKLEIINFFRAVYGWPCEKSAAITEFLDVNSIDPDDAVFIGDAATDFHSACISGVNFILRRSVSSSGVNLRDYDREIINFLE